MPRARSPNRDRAYDIYEQNGGNIENKAIAEMLGEKEKTISNWKCRDKWNVVLQKDECSTTKRRGKGAQPGNKNAIGNQGNKYAMGSPKNNNAEKFGFFRKYLPRETVSIIEEMPKNPLDILWDQIQIAYAAIIRAQQIMYVRDQDDVTTTQIQEKNGDTVSEERWEVQQAWDKHGNFLQAQARAQAELRSLIKQYDERLHKNWDMATEEQKCRIAYIKAQTAAIAQKSDDDDIDDGVEIVIDV